MTNKPILLNSNINLKAELNVSKRKWLLNPQLVDIYIKL